MVLIAERVVREGLEAWTPGYFPDRPVDLPVDDSVIRAALDGAQSARPAREDVEMARRYLRWRSMLMDAEGRAKSRLAFLLGVYEDLVGAGKPSDDNPTGDEHLLGCAATVQQHAWLHFRANMEQAPGRSHVAERDLWLHSAVRRHDLVSSWLLYGERAPGFRPIEEQQPHWSDER